MNGSERDVIQNLTHIADQLLSGKRKIKIGIEDIDGIEDEGLRVLTSKLVTMAEQYTECSSFIVDLSSGKLCSEPPRMNAFANPFKQLHSELRHLTWQIQQIADGDYDQRVSFLGDFSDAINKMIVDLRERRTLAEELRESNRTKDRILSIISHDLKSPFSALLGTTNMLVHEVNNENINVDRIKKYSTILNEATSTTFNLLINLLDWSRLQSNRIVIKPEKLNLNDIILDNVNIAHTAALHKNITLKYTTPGDYPIVSDRAMISTILRNLISNAIKYTSYNGTVEVSLNKNISFYYVSIQDNGVGIPADKINLLFESDTNQSTPGTANEKGTGLGLGLCKEFINKLGGDIWVESSDGQGTKFSFSLDNL